MRASRSRFIVSWALPAHRQRKSRNRLRSALISQKVPSWNIIFPLSGLGVEYRRSKAFCGALQWQSTVSVWQLCELLFRLVSQVAGIKGMFLANKRTDNQVKTHITYNRGRDWRLLQAPNKDLRSNNVHCMLVSLFWKTFGCRCSLWTSATKTECSEAVEM